MKTFRKGRELGAVALVSFLLACAFACASRAQETLRGESGDVKVTEEIGRAHV